MDKDFNNFPPFFDYGMGNSGMSGPPPQGMDMNDMYKDPFFNPMLQYEQAYTYYRYLCMQMDYKIKCKEYEKLCNDNLSSPSVRTSSDKSQRRVE